METAQRQSQSIASSQPASHLIPPQPNLQNEAALPTPHLLLLFPPSSNPPNLPLPLPLKPFPFSSPPFLRDLASLQPAFQISSLAEILGGPLWRLLRDTSQIILFQRIGASSLFSSSLYNILVHMQCYISTCSKEIYSVLTYSASPLKF